MTDHPCAHPPAPPTPVQIRSTRETLEVRGDPSDATTQDNHLSTTQVDPRNRTHASVQPSAGVRTALPQSVDAWAIHVRNRIPGMAMRMTYHGRRAATTAPRRSTMHGDGDERMTTPTWAYEHELGHVWHDLRRARQRAAAREAATDEHFLQELVHVLRPPDPVSSTTSDHERAVGT